MNEKKVLIISPCDLPIPAVQGGAVGSLIESVVKCNESEKMLDITVYSSWTKEAEDASKKYSSTKFIWFKYGLALRLMDYIIDFIRGILTNDKKHHDYLRKISVIKKAQKIILKSLGRFDTIILENSAYLLNVINGQIADQYKNKIYYHIHNDLPQNTNRRALEEVRPILISRYLEKNLVEISGSTDILNKCRIVKNGIDCNLFTNRFSHEKQEFRKSLGFSNYNNVIIYVGRINKTKGIDKLIDAVIKLNDPSVVLMIVGATNFGSGEKSPFEEGIKEKCEQLGDRVKLIGFIHNSMLWKYYAASDLACLPSVWEEPAGLTMLEASCVGIPLITTISGGIPEYIKSEYALLIKNNEHIVENITDGIRNILNNKKVWIKKARQASNYVKENYSENSYYQNFVSVIYEEKADERNTYDSKGVEK